MLKLEEELQLEDLPEVVGLLIELLLELKVDGELVLKLEEELATKALLELVGLLINLLLELIEGEVKLVLYLELDVSSELKLDLDE